MCACTILKKNNNKFMSINRFFLFTNEWYKWIPSATTKSKNHLIQSFDKQMKIYKSIRRRLHYRVQSLQQWQVCPQNNPLLPLRLLFGMTLGQFVFWPSLKLHLQSHMMCREALRYSLILFLIKWAMLFCLSVATDRPHPCRRCQ